MNANDTFAFETALALAATFRHGWAPFAAHAAGAADITDAFARISAAMEADEARARVEGTHRCAMELGLRPSLSHATGSGRISWEIGLDGTAVVTVNRPSGACVIFDLARGRGPRITFPLGIVREPRHIEAGRWPAEALVCENRYINAVPPAEFHAWREWSIENG